MTTTKKKTVKPLPELPINPFVYEILELASKQRSKAKKIEVLKKYEHDSLKIIFVWNFDESVISMVPEAKFLMEMQKINLYTLELCLKISQEKPEVVSLPLDKTWMDEVKPL